MRIFISTASNLPKGLWYHGSPKKYNQFDTNAEKLNRGSNPQGIYLTQDKKLAQEFAGKSGYVYTVQPRLANVFLYKQTPITKRFEDAYIKAILRFTNYKLDWIQDAFIPRLYQEKRMRNEFSGELLTYAYTEAGYDGLIFADMYGDSLVVFDHENALILNVEQV